MTNGTDIGPEQAGPDASRWRNPTTILCGVLAGLIGWFALGFNHVLPPHYVGWILAQTEGRVNWYADPGTSYAGWQYFRRAPWQIPLGTNRDYGLEFGSSLIYSDSIPLLAFLFKPLNPWLGTDFQYEGFWILACFLSQGVLAALLASKIIRQPPAILMIAAFFTLAPVMQDMGWIDYSLMAHAFILWGIYLYFTPRRPERVRWAWIAQVALTVTTHFYYVPMVLLLWSAESAKSLIQRTLRWRVFLAEASGMTATLLGCMWLVGYFLLSVKDTQTHSFGTHAVNLLGFIDPYDRSMFLHSQPHSPLWRGGAFCYFGLGMILLCALALVAWIRCPVPAAALRRVLPLAAAMIVLAAFSVSNEIALGSHVMTLPNFWGPLGGIFRFSGRMIWPAYYGIWLAAFYLALRRLHGLNALLLLVVLLTIQVVDLSPDFRDMRRKYAATQTWDNPLVDAFWQLATHRYTRIIIVPSGHMLAYIPLAEFGATSHLPINAAYMNRYPGTDVIGPISDARLRNLMNDRLDPDTLYVIPETDRFCTIARGLSKEHGIGRINEYNIIAPDWFAAGKPAGAGSVVPAAGAAARTLLDRLKNDAGND
ncbi:MAG TPA: DUF6311 domain-containing protein [Tepidisphaeraceae bacterium]|nr:DUF6311 domain-containing protein [Tepidisphaeraceae bacterium]